MYFAYKHVAKKEYVFVYIQIGSSETCAVLVLCGLRHYGRKSMTKLGGSGFGAILFSAGEVPQLDDGLLKLNLLLKKEMETSCKLKSEISNWIGSENIFKLRAFPELTETMNAIFTTLQGLSNHPILKNKPNSKNKRRRKRTLSIEESNILPENPCTDSFPLDNSTSAAQIADRLGITQDTNGVKTVQPVEKKTLISSPPTIQPPENRTSLDSVKKSTYFLRKKSAAANTPSVQEANLKEQAHSPLLLLSDDDDLDKNEVYYQSQSGEKFPFSQMDIESLAPQAWLNDSIINFYLQYLVDHAADVTRKQVYLFSTYFYPRLTSDIKKSIENKCGCVRPWKSEDIIFNFKYAVIPINENDHWFLSIVILPSFKTKATKASRRCRVYVLNSMLEDEDDEKEFDNVGRAVNIYLAHEYKRVYSATFPNRLDDYKVIVPCAPQQGNGSDCGLFLLEYFEQFLKVLEKKSSLDKVDFEKWFPPKLVIFLQPKFITNSHA
ncbi:Hypothetical predicted protein [Cloeon dipterum]|uniref:Ubiquitin-like protease family profile domain-containing protein n=1 Tax=Cloeon dipterum TaxID=197152 RepID=A0A8S1DCT5_9INSE|nr:Hypothetical predicted protein [Cloeon dipterum]